MCFSATSSFMAAGVLTGIGVMSVKSMPSKSYWMFAVIPLFFALQQAVEGVVWLSGANGPVHNLSSYVFLLFAFVFWPTWMPASMVQAEQDKKRQRPLKSLLVLGVLVSMMGMYHIYNYQGPMTLINQHIEYGIGYPSNLLINIYLAFYVAVTVIPLFISSMKLSHVFGLLLLASMFYTYATMLKAFISVWCFFAAVLSFCIVMIVWRNRDASDLVTR